MNNKDIALHVAVSALYSGIVSLLGWHIAQWYTGVPRLIIWLIAPLIGPATLRGMRMTLTSGWRAGLLDMAGYMVIASVVVCLFGLTLYCYFPSRLEKILIGAA